MTHMATQNLFNARIMSFVFAFGRQIKTFQLVKLTM